jgi:transcriptional regulator with XRE-family HTH domain
MNTELLKKLRIDKGLTRRDVSLKTGLTENQIYALETGRSNNPTLETLTSLANFYEVKVSKLIGE